MMKQLCLAILGALSLGAVGLYAQSGQSNTVNSTKKQNWRDVAVQPDAHPDTASPADRQARDQFFARFFPATKDDLFFGLPVGAIVDPRLPEIRSYPDAFWAVATFVSFDVRDIAENEVYTEIHFRIERIVTTAAHEIPQAGTMIDVDLMGGTVQTASGATLQRFSSKAQWFYTPNPGSRCLIQFEPMPSGNFYAPIDFYDLSTGVAHAASWRARSFVVQGKSHVDGLSEADAVAYIQQAAPQK